MLKKSSKKPLTRGVMLLSAILTLSGCATTTASGATDSFCTLAVPFFWSTQDTDDTIKQAKSHNAVGIKVCGWKGSAK